MRVSIQIYELCSSFSGLTIVVVFAVIYLRLNRVNVLSLEQNFRLNLILMADVVRRSQLSVLSVMSQQMYVKLISVVIQLPQYLKAECRFLHGVPR